MKRRTRRIALALAMAVAVAIFIGAVVFERDGRQPDLAAGGGRVSAVGDSITFGEGVGSDQRELQSYPAQLQTLLGGSYEIVNFGYIGATAQAAGDVPYARTDAYAASLESNPSIVLLMLGTNDSKPQNWDPAGYESQLEKLVADYRNLSSHPEVYLMTPPEAYPNQAKIRSEVITDQIVPIVRRVGGQTGVTVIDVHSVTQEHPEYFPDGVHPNRDGAALIAATVRDVLDS